MPDSGGQRTFVAMGATIAGGENHPTMTNRPTIDGIGKAHTGQADRDRNTGLLPVLALIVRVKNGATHAGDHQPLPRHCGGIECQALGQCRDWGVLLQGIGHVPRCGAAGRNQTRDQAQAEQARQRIFILIHHRPPVRQASPSRKEGLTRNINVRSSWSATPARRNFHVAAR